jgi:hypothetical protein
MQASRRDHSPHWFQAGATSFLSSLCISYLPSHDFSVLISPLFREYDGILGLFCSLCRSLSRNANYTKPASTDSTSDSSDGGAGYKKGSMDSNDKTRDKLTYLQRILNARVYDIAIDTPLEPAPVISARCDPELHCPASLRLSHTSLSPHFFMRAYTRLNALPS